jgi:hypothetical protein
MICLNSLSIDRANASLSEKWIEAGQVDRVLGQEMDTNLLSKKKIKGETGSAENKFL